MIRHLPEKEIYRSRGYVSDDSQFYVRTYAENF